MVTLKEDYTGQHILVAALLPVLDGVYRVFRINQVNAPVN